MAKINTGNSATVNIEGNGLNEGDEVAIWTRSQTLIGAGIVSNGRATLTMWGDDVITTDVVEGAVQGEPLSITRWSTADGHEVVLSVTGWTDILSSTTHNEGFTYASDAVDIAQIVVPSTVGDGVPTVFALEQNYPNPFNPSTVISYSLPQGADVRVEVFNIIGQSVKVLVDETQSSGKHSVVFQAGDLASGMYLYNLRAGTLIQSRRMMLVK